MSALKSFFESKRIGEVETPSYFESPLTTLKEGQEILRAKFANCILQTEKYFSEDFSWGILRCLKTPPSKILRKSFSAAQLHTILSSVPDPGIN